MPPRESSVETRLVEAAAVEGWDTIKLSRTDAKGRPDRMFLRDGRVVFLEVKRPGEEPNRQQKNAAVWLQSLGFMADWVDNVDDGLKLLRRIW